MIRKKDLLEAIESLNKAIGRQIAETNSLEEKHNIRLWKLENPPEYKIGDCIKTVKNSDFDTDGIVRDVYETVKRGTIISDVVTSYGAVQKFRKYVFNSSTGIIELTLDQIRHYEQKS